MGTFSRQFRWIECIVIECVGNRAYGNGLARAGILLEFAMKKVYASPDRSQIEIVRQLLREEGIENRVLNENTSAVLGDVPFFKAHPEVWVREEDQLRAYPRNA